MKNSKIYNKYTCKLHSCKNFSNWPLDTFIHVFLHRIHSVDLFSDPGFGQNMLRDSGNANHIERKRDLTATREAGFTKIWARDVRLFFFPLSIRNSVNRKMRNRRM